ncbi:MAG: family 31 glucosidase, partial [Vallitalea sp.]|nr:family 31 glucosidase [Vallitalea sp.]
NEGEKIFGMGQYQQANLNLKGCILELAQRNSQASVPFMISNHGYGLLWNNPAIGKVTFGENLTEWTAKSTKQLDYWITVDDSPGNIEENYTDVVGRAPTIPEYALGFWQCKLRYQTQEELLEVAREYKRRGLPISVIVCDFYHWPYEGDWRFDEEYWPDPKAMVDELKDMGIELMVSVWPTVEYQSESFADMFENQMLVRTEMGGRITQLNNAKFIDATNQEARNYVWNKLKKNYYDYGIRTFWLDEAEPEYFEYAFEQYRYQLGSDLEVGNSYPRYYSQMVYDGLKQEQQEDVISLVRCAWVGSQKYGSLIWSGDIDSSFRSLRNQLSAGLNMGLAGIPWWTTDIGGFHGGHIEDKKFHECLVRWFEFGAFCPVFRLHGDREPHKKPLGTTKGAQVASGADNEVWTYGEEVYKICKKYMFIREKLREYIKQQMEIASTKGTPVMRPLFYDFYDDEKTWEIKDEYMFGSQILVAPILYEEMTERKVYFPEGNWIHIDTKEEYKGNQTCIVQAPLNSMPVFVLKGKKTNLIKLYDL